MNDDFQHVLGRKQLALACWVLSVLLVIVFCVPFQAEASTIRIAMITAKTGKAGKSNSISFDGARFSVAEINRTGGILGQRVELLEYDNKSTPEGSADAARQAIKDGVVAVVGCNWSSHSLGMAKVLQKAEVPMITHMSTNPSVTEVGDYIFRACFTDSFQGLGLARFARVRLKSRTAIILIDKDRTYSVGLAETFGKAFESLGGKIVWQATYSTSAADYDEIMQQVKKHNPDALFVPGGYEDVSAFFGRSRDMEGKWELLSADGIGIRLYDHIGDRAHGVYYSTHWSRWVDTTESKDFVARFEKEVRPANEDTYALVYDSFMVLRDAIERAKSVEHSKVRQALADTPGYKGVTGTIQFDAKGNPIKPMVINELKFGGILYLDQIYP